MERIYVNILYFEYWKWLSGKSRNVISGRVPRLVTFYKRKIEIYTYAIS